MSGLEPAWKLDATGVRLPVYHHWRFRTADAGDFEALVRRLVPRVLPSTVGIRDMDVSNPGGALSNVPAHDAPLGLEGALKAVTTQSTVWTPSLTRTRFVDRLKTLLNIPAALLKGTTPMRAVTPPLYGRWHAAQETLEPGQPPPWFHELNQDPRLRVTAGLGTLVVQQEQRSLMNEAWRQINDIKRINEELRLAQLARALAERLHIRHRDDRRRRRSRSADDGRPCAHQSESDDDCGPARQEPDPAGRAARAVAPRDATGGAAC